MLKQKLIIPTVGIDKIELGLIPNSPFLLRNFNSQKVLYGLTNNIAQCIAIDYDGNQYNWITVVLNSHATVKIRKTGVSTSIRISLTRIPDPAHPELGNLCNADYTTVNQQLKNALNTLKNEYGISVSRESITIRYIEINRTIQAPNDYETYQNALWFLFQDNARIKQVNYNTIRQSNGLYQVEQGSLKIAMPTMETCFYNKGSKLMQDHPNILSMNSTLLRLEFRAKKTETVQRWFQTSDWLRLNDNLIQNAYEYCLRRYVISVYMRVKQCRLQVLENFLRTYKATSGFKLGLADLYDRFLNKYKCPLVNSVNEFDIYNSIKANKYLNHNAGRYFKYYKEILSIKTALKHIRSEDFHNNDEILKFLFEMFSGNITATVNLEYEIL